MNDRDYDFPLLPYAGTSGWSGSDASRDRAERQDASGVTTMRQRLTLTTTEGRGHDGLTWKELAAENGWHHGQATALLSTLHKRGYLCRLKDRRGGCSIYVAPEFVGGRETAAQGRRGNGASVSDLQKEIRALRDKINKVEAVVAPKWRSYSYTRDNLMDDVRRALL